MKKEEVIELKAIKKALAELFYSKCRLCDKPFGKWFTLHHRKYLKNEKIYSDFANPLLYYRYLDPIIRKDTQRFSLLCKKHHSLIEAFKKFSPELLFRSLEELCLSSDLDFGKLIKQFTQKRA